MNKKRFFMILTLFFLLIFLAFAKPASAAELLVQAKPNWQDDWDTVKVRNLAVKEKQTYDARAQVGDIIVVRPDGWTWGKEECLPNYVVVKIPGISYEDAQRYEDVLKDEAGNILKKRKYRIPLLVVNGWKLAGKDVVTVDLADKSSFISSLVEKTQ